MIVPSFTFNYFVCRLLITINIILVIPIARVAEKILDFWEHVWQRIAEKYAKDCRKLAGGQINTPRSSKLSSKWVWVKRRGRGRGRGLSLFFFYIFLSFFQLIFFMFLFFFFFLAKTPIFRVLHQWCIIAISSHIKEKKCVRWSSFFSGTLPRTIRVTFTYIHTYIHTYLIFI